MKKKTSVQFCLVNLLHIIVARGGCCCCCHRHFSVFYDVHDFVFFFFSSFGFIVVCRECNDCRISVGTLDDWSCNSLIYENIFRWKVFAFRFCALRFPQKAISPYMMFIKPIGAIILCYTYRFFIESFVVSKYFEHSLQHSCLRVHISAHWIRWTEQAVCHAHSQ